MTLAHSAIKSLFGWAEWGHLGPLDHRGIFARSIIGKLLSSEHGTYKTVKARCWPRLSGKSSYICESCPFSNRRWERFRGGLVFQDHIILCHSTLGLRVIKKKKKGGRATVVQSSMGFIFGVFQSMNILYLQERSGFMD